MAPQKHVHKYQYINIGSQLRPRKVYACAFPSCSHFMPSIEQVKGKKTICWQCNDEMILSRDLVRHRVVKPRCLKCRGKIAPKAESRKLEGAIDMILAMRGTK